MLTKWQRQNDGNMKTQNHRQTDNKMTRNKNARLIFLHHFLTVAMISIICLYMHFLLHIFHTRSLFFEYLHYLRSNNNHCTKCTCTSCARTTRLFDAKICFFSIALFIYWTKLMRKEGLVVSFKMPKPILKLRNQFLGRLAAHFQRLRYIDVITYSYR